MKTAAQSLKPGRQASPLWWGLLCRWLLLALVCAAPLTLQAQKHRDLPAARRIQAGIIYNFIRFTSWPSGSLAKEAPVVIGILGDPLSAELIEKELSGLKAGDHELKIQNLEEDSPLEGIHVLFVLKRNDLKSTDILLRAQGKPVLTIGEPEGFAKQGGMIRLFLRNDRYHFTLNPKAAKEAGLTLSSQLGALAEPDTD